MAGFKKGGTPVYASPEAFGGRQDLIDEFSFGRIVCFLCLDHADFLQLLFMPIEKEETRKKIRMAIDQFEVFIRAKKSMQTDVLGRCGQFEDVSNLAPLLISRADLIAAGIPQNWFLDPKYNLNNIEQEQFNLNNIS